MKKSKRKFWDKAGGILGMNARNLLYVNRYNSKGNKKFADDKIFTKNYLTSRGLGAAKIYAVIKNHQELSHFNFESLPSSFVIKPNRGFGGEGIMVIAEKKKNEVVDISGNVLPWKHVYQHILSILDGKYAISGLSDQVIMEETLVMHEYFKRFSEAGLPDIRVIVFNNIPVMAMLRLPTHESQGKANLHLGAVGVGIDISSGKATHAVQRNRFITKLPNGEKIRQIQIPDWENILLMAAKAQHASQIGFMAADIAPCQNGPKILELNARPGLAVQIANQIPLKNRLKKIADINITTPEKGVEVSKTLFGARVPSKEKKEEKEKRVIGLYESVEILNSKLGEVTSKIDPHSETVFVDKTLEKELKKKSGLLEIKLKGQRLALPYKFENLENQKYRMIIGGKFLKDFLVDLNKNEPISKSINKKIIKGKSIDEKILQNIDKKIFNIESHINVIASVTPIDTERAKREFFANPDKSPFLVYNKPSGDIKKLKRELKSLPTDFKHPLAKIYTKKITEVGWKLDILEAVNTSKLQSLSTRLYGKVDKSLYEKSLRYIKENPIKEDRSKEFNQKQIVKKIENYLKQNRLTKWKIKIQNDRLTNISVSKNGTIFLREKVTFTENKLKALIIHEIATHIYRLENGKLQKYKIFEKGTANYLTTEEGLAIYNQKQLGLNLGKKDIWPALLVAGIYLADEMSFSELFAYLKENFNFLDDEGAWKICLRAKRGLGDTSKKIAFTRDSIYFRGYLQVSDYLKQNPENGLRNLYIGKINVNDLSLLENLDDYKTRYLPNYESVKNI